jgi:tetratricopeptide (TPR) repeat protein
MAKLPPALVESLRLRQAVIVTGARCSELAELPAWAALGAALVEWVEEPERRAEVRTLLDGGRPLAALARLRDILSDDVVTEVIADAVPAEREVPAPLAAVAQIPWRAVVTTALDDLWERAAAASGVPTLVLLPGQRHELDDPQRMLLQLFGRASAPESLCLGPRDVRTKLALAGTGALLAEAHRRWSFVFVGFRPGDPDLALVAERLLGSSASEAEDFLLCPGASEAEAQVTGAELALTAVPLEGDVAAALEALFEAWTSVKEASRPPAEDVDGWLELWSRDPGDAEAPRIVAAAIDRLREAENWERLVTLLVQRAELAREPEVQGASLREVGRIFDAELDQPDRAYRALVTALRLQPDDLELVKELKRLARKANLWEDFVSEFGGLVDTMADPADSAHLVIEMGRIYAEDAGRHDQAIASFERALAHDPGSPEALAGLEDLYRQTARWGDLARILGEREGRATDATLRRKLRTERIELLLSRLHDGPAAILALEAAVSDDPDDRVALRSLEALYREQHREAERLSTLERLVPLAESDEERIGLLRRLAAGQRSQADGGLAALERAFALGDRHEDTLESLARTYEQRGDWRACAEVLDRWSELGPPEARAQLLARAGKLYLDKLHDSAAGEERYARALELDPRNPAVLAALAHLSRDGGDFFRAAKFLVESEAGTRNPLEKARLLHEAALLYQDRLDDEAKATELYARVLAADPGHAAAAGRLAPLYEKAGSWAALEPVLDMLVRRAEGPDAEVADLHRRLGECARKLGKNDLALKSFEAARALAPESVPVLRALGDLQMEKQSWTEARAHYASVRRLAENALSIEEKIELFVRLGRCELHLDQPESARLRFEEALALEPPTRTTAVTERRVQLYEELGDLSFERLQRIDEAITAYQQALALAPSRRQLLHKLLGLFTEQKKWPGALAMLGKLGELESAPALRAKYHYAAAVIQRDELHDATVAAELFNKALDDDPDMQKAFEAIERLYTEAQDWKALARAYRRMIKRLPEKGLNDLRARLWNGLGVVSLRYLGDREAAILALEVASSLERENLARRELLADLYVEAGTPAIDKAIAEHQFIISRRPDRIESYQALAALFQQRQAYDQLWCVAGALTHLGHADHYLRTFWERHRMAEVPVAVSKMGHEQWQRIVHPREDPFISGLFALVAQALALTTAQRHQSVGVKRSDRIDLTKEWLPGAALRYLSSSMEIPLPDVYVRESDPQTVAIYNLRDRGGLTPALVLGQGYLQWSSQWEMVFDLGKRMAFLRPERFPRFALMSPVALDIAVRAALALGGAPIGHGPHNGEVERTRSKLAELVPPPVAQELSLVAKRFLEARGEIIDIPAWIAAADLTATRAAFVLASDLPAAVRVLGAEPAGLTPLPLAERIKDLVAYSVSEDYFAVRQSLGLQVV